MGTRPTVPVGVGFTLLLPSSLSGGLLPALELLLRILLIFYGGRATQKQTYDQGAFQTNVHRIFVIDRQVAKCRFKLSAKFLVNY